ncbi:hypothetical protein A2774_00585 [Candidatus Roizmanbacteria bacterium RIFCSPHIGHO2_01_FULL_39_12c]|uniref:Uncharacterized protein n=1 Tax=Candidatus Roizmanbacteria bacterium RIFCSPHIGHO2_01_FULL_39_12c TaxID=1802031 RepID=A0A1F7GA27_9BACT|nr:MAG: hypothetical protein A2774_00585 [Candidatus Roizmanbacteria bacterium RIFCSPHIGHO2_01_FULL_39_12c]OGK47367.1 MAG: hypothetical protein A2963_04505 [Candidatus Roizmanbacteria bacterium RIFCSPLOWO2_01_FULL_40_13]
MRQSKLFSFNLILSAAVLYLILVPYPILINSIKTGKATSKSTNIITTDEGNTLIQNNSATAITNTGGNTSNSNSVTTGDAKAISEMTVNNGSVEGRLEVEVNGEKKEMTVDKPGDYKLELNKEGDAVASVESTTPPKSTNKSFFSLLKSLLNSLLSFF